MRNAEPVQALPSATENRCANLSRVDDKERGDAMRGVPRAFFEGLGSRFAMVGHSAGGASIGKKR